MDEHQSVDEIARRSAAVRNDEVSSILRESRPYTIMCTTVGALGAVGVSSADVPWYYSAAVIVGGYVLGRLIDDHYQQK